MRGETKTWTLFKCRWFGVKLQRLPKRPTSWHRHPFRGLVILFGTVQEQRHAGFLFGEWSRRWFVNIVGHWHHRVKNGCWALLIHGPEREYGRTTEDQLQPVQVRVRDER